MGSWWPPASRSWTARRVLLTTGVVDIAPDAAGGAAVLGSAIVQCPFCHGWEARDEPAALLLDDDTMLAEMLRFYGRWAPRLVAIAASGYLPTPEAMRVLREADVPLYTSAIGPPCTAAGRRLESVEFADGTGPRCPTILPCTTSSTEAQLVRDLGLDLSLGCCVTVDKDYTSTGPGPLFRTLDARACMPRVDATSMAQAAQLAAFEGIAGGASADRRWTVLGRDVAAAGRCAATTTAAPAGCEIRLPRRCGRGSWVHGTAPQRFTAPSDAAAALR